MAHISSDQIQQMRQLLQEAKSLAIVLPANPPVDAVASALSLYLILSVNGKQVGVSSPTPMKVEHNQLVGVDKISGKIQGGAGKNLIISFPYQDGSIEKVSYNIEQDTFNLVIEPRDGFAMITPDAIRYSTSGGVIDTIITVGVSRLADLGELYSANQQLFSEKPILNIDTNTQNERFGKVHIVDPTLSSVSELMISMLTQVGLQLDIDVSSNLLTGIITATNNFTSAQTTAATFEAAALCMKNGGRVNSQSSQARQPFPSASSFLHQGKPPAVSQSGFTPKPAPVSIKSQDQEKATFPAAPVMRDRAKNAASETPADWLKPKIYKGTSLS